MQDSSIEWHCPRHGKVQVDEIMTIASRKFCERCVVEALVILGVTEVKLQRGDGKPLETKVVDGADKTTE